MITCLRCKKRIAMTRGCCKPCYNLQQRDVTSGLVSDEMLVRRGERAPAKAKRNFYRSSGEEYR